MRSRRAAGKIAERGWLSRSGTDLTARSERLDTSLLLDVLRLSQPRSASSEPLRARRLPLARNSRLQKGAGKVKML